MYYVRRREGKLRGKLAIVFCRSRGRSRWMAKIFVSSSRTRGAQNEAPNGCSLRPEMSFCGWWIRLLFIYFSGAVLLFFFGWLNGHERREESGIVRGKGFFGDLNVKGIFCLFVWFALWFVLHFVDTGIAIFLKLTVGIVRILLIPDDDTFNGFSFIGYNYLVINNTMKNYDSPADNKIWKTVKRSDSSGGSGGEARKRSVDEDGRVKKTGGLGRQVSKAALQQCSAPR